MSRHNPTPRNRWIRRAAPGVLLLATLAASGCVVGLGFPWREAREVQVRRVSDVQFSGEGPLRVHTANGRIRLRQVSGPTTIQATLRATTRERLEESRVVAERRSDGGLDLSVDWAGGGRRSNEGCDFDIEIPGAPRVVLETSNGSIRLQGLDGEAWLETSNSRIDVRDHRGAIRAETSNGRVVIDGASAEVEVETSNGSIEVLGSGGPVNARTSNAPIEVRLDRGGTGPVELRSSNAPIELTIPRSFAGELHLLTSHGRIKVDEIPGAEVTFNDADDARIRVGNSDQASRLKTSNSSIRVFFDDR